MFKYYIIIFSYLTGPAQPQLWLVLSAGWAMSDYSIVVAGGAELLPTRIVNGLAKLHTTYATSASILLPSPSSLVTSTTLGFSAFHL